MAHIKYNKDIERCYIGGVLITKGLNQISDTEYEKLKKHPNYKKLLENKTIEELKDEVKKEEKPKTTRRKRAAKKVEEPKLEVDIDKILDAE